MRELKRSKIVESSSVSDVSFKKLSAFSLTLLAIVEKLDEYCSYDTTTQFNRYLSQYTNTRKAIEDILDHIEDTVEDLKMKQKKQYKAI